MATSKEYCEYIVENLSRAGNITVRKMMGEYCVYFNGVLVGDICDNQLFLKITATSEKLLSECEEAYPYSGSKTLMLVVDDVSDTLLMTAVLNGIYNETNKRRN